MQSTVGNMQMFDGTGEPSVGGKAGRGDQNAADRPMLGVFA
jgi:hypothetical protein